MMMMTRSVCLNEATTAHTPSHSYAGIVTQDPHGPVVAVGGGGGCTWGWPWGVCAGRAYKVQKQCTHGTWEGGGNGGTPCERCTHNMRVGWGWGGLHKHLTRSEGALEATRAHDGPKHARVRLCTHVHQEQHTALWEGGGGSGAAQQTPHTPGVAMAVKPQRHTHALGSRGERGSRVLVQRGGDALFSALSTGASHVRCAHTPARKHTTHQVRDSPEGGEGCV